MFSVRATFEWIWYPIVEHWWFNYVFCLIYNRKLSVYHFVCARIFFRVVFSSNGQKHHTHILTSVIKLPNCLELVQNKFCRKKSKMNVLVECARVWCVGTTQIWILKSILWNYQSNTKSLIVRIYLELNFYLSEDIFIIIQITRWRFFANFTYLPYCVLPCIAWQ